MSIVKGAAPPPEGVVPNLQHPEDVLHTINLVSQILSITAVSLFMLLRIYAKAFIAPPFHTEDCKHRRRRVPALRVVCSHFIGVAILTIGYSATALVMSSYGGGYHVYELSTENLAGFMRLTSSLGLYADTLVYGPNSFFTKLALLLIVIRVFRFHQKTKIGIYITIAFMVGYYVPVFFLKTFICRPINGFWDTRAQAICLNQREIFVADTVISAVTDLAVLCLPIPAALSLRMSWNRRLKVIIMLSAGGVATAASIARMVIVVRLRETKDETVEFIRFNLLGTAEVSIGMICACFPATNILLSRRFDKSQESSRNTTGSSSKRALKFLRGSKLETQEMTEVQTEDAEEGHQPSPPQEGGDFIFPIERISRLPPALQRGWSTETYPDEWSSNLVTSPFSDTGAPEWARKGSVA
ncbi:hypothetical protein LZ30DRAFT_808714 [Colletotrichum cereale]|nr:hypothetical protein LZ30DRAFT_808714 [Colletotrichum cereale]